MRDSARIAMLAARVEKLEADLAQSEKHRVQNRDTAVSATLRISQLELALREIADFSEQFIADDEDGDEHMYKVHTIADIALGFQSWCTE